MRPLTGITLAICTTAILFACSGPTEPDDKSFIYPLAVGNHWVYEYTEISVYSDSAQTDTIRYTLTATVIKADTILPGIVACLIQESGTEPGGSVLSGYRSYINMPGGMYAYYRSQPAPTIVLPKSVTSAADRPMNSKGSLETAVPGPLPLLADGTSMSEYYDPAPLVLPYPQEVGRRWLVGDTMRYIEGRFWLDKQITGWETVTTPAGTFNGVVIDWIYQWPFESIEESCVMASVGMVSRTANFYDIDITTYEFPYGTGETKDVYTKYELVSYTLH